MAKDDYDVIVFRILTYLYACLKRRIVFDLNGFDHALRRSELADGYLTDILRMMHSEELIEGGVFTPVWGGEYILATGLEELRITPAGIRYLTENDRMAKIKKHLLETVDVISGLIGLL